MRRNYLIPLIFTTFVTLLIYGFIILTGKWMLLLMGFFFLLGISHYLDKYLESEYFLSSFGILISVFVVTLIYVNHVRNNSTEKIIIQGEIVKINNSHDYVHFGIREYPDISFKSYNAKVRRSFRAYILDNNYQPILVNNGKKAQFTVFKSHLEWCQSPICRYLKNLRFPLEVDIESFRLIE